MEGCIVIRLTLYRAARCRRRLWQDHPFTEAQHQLVALGRCGISTQGHTVILRYRIVLANSRTERGISNGIIAAQGIRQVSTSKCIVCTGYMCTVTANQCIPEARQGRKIG
ncbi:hypothetical protein D3C80_1579760 [compost metagenome]